MTGTDGRPSGWGAKRFRDIGDHYTEWIHAHEVAWELVMAALAGAFVVVGMLLGGAEDAGVDATGLEQLDLALTVIFVAEFGTRFAAARSRSAYLRAHWIDALALVPTVRGLRLLRLIRLLRLLRMFAGVFRALSSLQRFAAHRGLVALFIAWLAVAVISGSAFYLAEAGINNSVTNPIDALWWAVVTLTTVGYGDVFPVTPEGRLAGAALMIIGITLWAAITGMITSLLIASRSAEGSVAERIRQLDELRRDGLLTTVEFESKKTELLERM